MKIIINDNEYELIENNRDSFDYDEIKNKLMDVDYFDKYDYILGDYSYDKLRLKGFCDKSSKDINESNNYENIDRYIKNYCSFGCKYFILKKKK